MLILACFSVLLVLHFVLVHMSVLTLFVYSNSGPPLVEYANKVRTDMWTRTKRQAQETMC